MAKKKITVLLGAGASIDAGLPDTFRLTRSVYDELVMSKSGDAQLFAVVVAKLIARNARSGGSPFDMVNIEEVYDALKRLLNRESDLLSEFVSGWDQITLGSASHLDTNRLARNLAEMFVLTDRRSLSGRSYLQPSSQKIGDIVKQLTTAIEGDLTAYRGASLSPFLDTLARQLEFETARTDYMQTFLEKMSDSIECIATLNYDRVVETSLEEIGSGVDLGLGQWNEKRFVRFHGRAPKLIKLHGSLDWYLRNDDEIVEDNREEPRVFPAERAMIFGGQSDKLVPFGPFLHLRHEFQRFLRNSSYLLVIGYSYQDVHLNAIIRSWIATRNAGKLINVDPRGLKAGDELFRYATVVKDGKLTRKRVEISEIKNGFAAAIPQIFEEIEKEPDLKVA